MHGRFLRFSLRPAAIHKLSAGGARRTADSQIE
jgi:hypothetical protein